MYVVPSDRLRPGEICKVSGVYRVYHHAHRLPHSVYVAAGTVLPKCRRCGDRVEFGLVLASEPAERDHDLVRAAEASG